MASSDASTAPALVWFRDDLRLSDNPALHAAVARGRPVLCVYVLDDESSGLRPMGGAARWWAHHALSDLAASLAAIGGRLDVFQGPADEIIDRLVAASGAETCFWNRRYGRHERAQDERIALALAGHGVAVETFNGTLLHEPGEVRSKTGGAFRVFTPYRRAALAFGPGRQPLPAPTRVAAASETGLHVSLADLHLLPTHPDWAAGFRATWKPGEQAARTVLDTFLDGPLARYAEDRNRPGSAGSSGLSPFLRSGEISARQVYFRAEGIATAAPEHREAADKFISEVLWRDFSYGLLAQYPDLATVPVIPAFTNFPYRDTDPDELRAWQTGRTGYPVVDAGMRQLWQTGVMHNRVRMITASFLVKHLLFDWRHGEQWFWDTLCDADPASNPTNWQWVAGCGADPTPYFRIFNPTLQAETFDPEGAYVKRFVPELERLPARWIHKPWAAPAPVLAKAGVVLGSSYPRPVVEHGAARVRALAALKASRPVATSDAQA